MTQENKKFSPKLWIRKIRKKFLGADHKYIPVLRLEGMIASKANSRKAGLCISAVKEALNDAFTFDDSSDKIILLINSPGGSPTQSSLIYQYLNFLKKKHKKEILVFVEDVAASGGYYIACAGDKIYADHHSIIGSIGVVSGGFGFVDAMKKLGVERRVHTSGENKSMLDPFSPEKAEDIEHLKSLQTDIHEIFKSVVKESRGDKLQSPEENELFTGKFWVSQKAKSFGLIDDIKTIEDVMSELYKDKYKLVPIETDKRGFFEKRFGLDSDIISDAFVQVFEKLNSKKFS